MRASIQGVVREALIAAGLTGLMILLFLGSWRSTLIVCISIPLSILTSLCILSLLGQTINVMTLGGLALAVGILVDDATVEIENTHRNIAMRKPLVRAVLDGASQIAVPTFVATLSICIVFVPVLLLTGTAALSVYSARHGGGVRDARVLFAVPHAGSDHDGLSARSRDCLYREGADGAAAGGKGPIWSAHHVFNALFEKLRYRYMGLLDWSLGHRGRVLGGLHGRLARVAGTGGADRRRFLPRCRRRPDAPSRARSGRHANRRNRTAIRRARARNPRRHSAGSARHADRQHRHPQQLAGDRAGRHPHHLLRPMAKS